MNCNDLILLTAIQKKTPSRSETIKGRREMAQEICQSELWPLAWQKQKQNDKRTNWTKRWCLHVSDLQGEGWLCPWPCSPRGSACLSQWSCHHFTRCSHPCTVTSSSLMCHGSLSAGSSVSALLCASDSLSPLCHSCLLAPPSMRDFQFQLPAGPAGIQTASFWDQTPCSRHMDMCTAGCNDTLQVVLQHSVGIASLSMFPSCS